jgi:cell division septum initiation protein DivIVA
MLNFKSLDQLKQDYKYYLEIYPRANRTGQEQIKQHLERLKKQIQWLEQTNHSIKKVFVRGH